uniref:Membrane protein ORF8 n=1 Tax=Anguillid herpesvirus 1 TaxID=150286 RepID=A0A8E5AFM0_9VIRU|nr:membrane protein ORF8 [Anguillid herpesvirus 1]
MYKALSVVLVVCFSHLSAASTWQTATMCEGQPGFLDCFGGRFTADTHRTWIKYSEENGEGMLLGRLTDGIWKPEPYAANRSLTVDADGRLNFPNVTKEFHGLYLCDQRNYYVYVSVANCTDDPRMAGNMTWPQIAHAVEAKFGLREPRPDILVGTDTIAVWVGIELFLLFTAGLSAYLVWAYTHPSPKKTRYSKLRPDDDDDETLIYTNARA